MVLMMKCKTHFAHMSLRYKHVCHLSVVSTVAVGYPTVILDRVTFPLRPPLPLTPPLVHAYQEIHSPPPRRPGREMAVSALFLWAGAALGSRNANIKAEITDSDTKLERTPLSGIYL